MDMHYDNQQKKSQGDHVPSLRYALPSHYRRQAQSLTVKTTGQTRQYIPLHTQLQSTTQHHSAKHLCLLLHQLSRDQASGKKNEALGGSPLRPSGCPGGGAPPRHRAVGAGQRAGGRLLRQEVQGRGERGEVACHQGYQGQPPHRRRTRPPPLP